MVRFILTQTFIASSLDNHKCLSLHPHKGEKKYASGGMKSRIKSMFNLMLDYALEYEIVDRNYARTFDISDDVTKEIETTKRNHIIFSDDEMKILWDNVNMPYVDWIIIQCYMG